MVHGSRLYDIKIDKGLSLCEATRLTLVYEYCKIYNSDTAIIILERLDKSSGSDQLIPWSGSFVVRGKWV